MFRGEKRRSEAVGARLDDRRFAVAAVGRSHGRAERRGRCVTGSIGLTWIEYAFNIKISSQNIETMSGYVEIYTQDSLYLQNSIIQYVSTLYFFSFPV